MLRVSCSFVVENLPLANVSFVAQQSDGYRRLAAIVNFLKPRVQFQKALSIADVENEKCSDCAFEK